MKLSIVIPAYNEEDSIVETINSIVDALKKTNILYEILIVNDNSTDNTCFIINELSKKYPNIAALTNPGPNGFGYAVRFGLERFSGDCVAIMMADLSDSPYDLIRFYTAMTEGNFDCVFGSRFIKGAKVVDYPIIKLLINRLANSFIKVLMGIRYNDTTNAFKLYKRSVIEGINPILSPHFNLTIELPLKAIIRGYTYTVVPNSWTNRQFGVSKLKIKEMGSRYFFILIYCFVEKLFTGQDYKKRKL